jgi:hypothetical protein
MGLDIKIPIGLMFAIFGVILGIYGLATEGNEMYIKSLNYNINLLSGATMFVFGLVMLAFSDLMKKRLKSKKN